MKTRKKILIVAALLPCLQAGAQQVRTVSWTTNTDESKVPEYALPDPLLCNDGITRVASADDWEKIRRPEILDMLTTYMYGKAPAVANLG